MRKTLMILLGLGFSPSLFAEEAPESPSQQVDAEVHELVLEVLAKGTGRPLKRAEVKLGTELFTTDPEGKVRLRLTNRESLLEIQRSGYESQIVSVKDFWDKADAKIYLLPGKPDDSEVIITGARRPEVSRKTVSVKETSRIAPGGDAAQVTQLLPGVQSSPGRTDVVIRGSGPNDSRYFVDDIEVPSIFHNVANLSIVPSQQLASVDFASGGFGVQYGDATGGVIVLRSVDQLPEYGRTEFVLNVPFYLGVFHERPLSEKSSLAVSLRRSMIESILPKVLPEDLGATVIPSFYDSYIRYVHKDDNVTHKLTVISSSDGLSLIVPSQNSDREDGKINVEFQNYFAVIAGEREQSLGDGWRLRTTPQFRVFRLKANFSSDNLYLRGRTVAVPTELSQRLDKNRSFYLGVNPEWNRVQLTARIPVFDGNDPYFDPEEAPRKEDSRLYTYGRVAAWSAIDLSLGDMIISPGVRVFQNQLVKGTGVDPRLQGRYPLDSQHMVKFAVGQYSISPEPAESSKTFGNPNLGFERSNQYVLGLDSKWGDRWQTEFQTFYKKIYKLIVAGGSENFTDTGSRQVYGFEAFVRRNLTEKLFGWLSYTYSQSKERESDADNWYRSSFDQTHILNLAGSYKLNALWDLGARFKYNTGEPYTPVESSVYNANLDKYQPVYDEKNPYSERIPDFHSLDLFATYDSLYEVFKLKYQFGIQYLALGKRVSSVDYNFDYSEKEFVANLPPIPYIQISGEF